MFVKQMANGSFYVCRKTHGSKKNPHCKGSNQNWFLIKTDGDYCAAITTFHKGAKITCPASWLGKKVRLKIEFFEERKINFGVKE